MTEVYENMSMPSPVGPYSQAVKAGKFLFISGQLPIDPVSGNIVGKDICTQARQSLLNLKSIIEASKMEMSNIIKVNIFLKDISQFSALNEVYIAFFKHNFPARSAVEVSQLPKGALIEIEAVAYKE
jgi:2-iminobutanoate/2-iminopropanoate deaminase